GRVCHADSFQYSQVVLYYTNFAHYSTVFYICISLMTTCSCYFILKRHSRKNRYSMVARKMQDRLRKSLLVQIFVYLMTTIISTVLPNFLSLLFSILKLPEILATSISQGYGLVSFICLAWYQFIIAIVIQWSIPGFLVPRTPPGRIGVATITVTTRIR
ncbi:hypothetical protein V3C99_004019, partial [Haemonchus contortus]|uniref:G protein-coupled receptor n=1 Tax=Haemonchus contortus TaxID=6289 RepID=A0A7I4XYH4_HAECO